jgi:rhamnulokinase
VATRPEIVRCIIDTMALAIRDGVCDAVDLSSRSVSVVHVAGGGVENELFCQSVADACELPVVAGPTEATSWGNILAQARALGVVTDSLAGTRAMIRRAEQPRSYLPQGDGARWARAAESVRG